MISLNDLSLELTRLPNSFLVPSYIHSIDHLGRRLPQYLEALKK